MPTRLALGAVTFGVEAPGTIDYSERNIETDFSTRLWGPSRDLTEAGLDLSGFLRYETRMQQSCNAG